MERRLPWDTHHAISRAISELIYLCDLIDVETDGDDTTKGAKKEIHNLCLVLKDVIPLCDVAPSIKKGADDEGEEAMSVRVLIGDRWVPIGQDQEKCEHPKPWTPVRVNEDGETYREGLMCHACCKVMGGQ